jgi:hypothetical protein
VLALVIGTGLVVVAATIVAASLPWRGAIAFALAVAVLSQAMIVTTVGIAGLLIRSFSPAVLLALAGAWLVAAGLVAYRKRRLPILWPKRWRATVGVVGSTLREPSVAIAAVLVVGILAWRAFLAARLPVVDYDGWSYHLVYVDVWLPHDALTLVPLRPWTAGYPAATEMLTTWLAAFTHSDTFTGFTSLLPIPLAMLAMMGLARSFGADRPRAALAGLLFAMTPGLIALAGTSYVDASSIAMVAATWWLGLRVVRGERDVSTALLLGIAGGLACGTKGLNVALVGPILAVAGVLLLRDLLARPIGSNATRTTVTRLAALVVPLLILGASWYLKNLVVYGNPVYPFAFGPFHGPTTLTDFAMNIPKLSGRSLISQLATSWTADWHLTRYAYNVRPGGLGRAWPVILVIAIGGFLLLVRRRQLDAVALVIVPATITLLVMPMPWYARYTLFLVAIALPLVALALSTIRPSFATIAGLGLVGLAAISVTFANIRPNIDLRPAVATVGVRDYLAFVFDADASHRANVDLRAACAGFSVIPPGARVVPGGFNLLHGVAGPNFDRILTDLVGTPAGPEELASAMRAQGAEWLATSAGGRLDQLAASAPDLFLAHGDTCRTGRLWQLAPGAGG